MSVGSRSRSVSCYETCHKKSASRERPVRADSWRYAENISTSGPRKILDAARPSNRLRRSAKDSSSQGSLLIRSNSDPNFAQQALDANAGRSQEDSILSNFSQRPSQKLVSHKILHPCRIPILKKYHSSSHFTIKEPMSMVAFHTRLPEKQSRITGQ